MRTSVLFLAVATILGSSTAQLQTQQRVTEKEGMVINDSVRIWYRVEGPVHSDALPIVFIHGGPGATARPFEKTIGPEISKTRVVVYTDCRGAGRSDRPKDPDKYSSAILASDIEALRKHLGIERWVVFGHSIGGAIAITYALHHPERSAALILCDPLLSPADLEMSMVHKVALAPPDKYQQARAIYKSAESSDTRFGKLLDVLDDKARDRFQFCDVGNSAVLGRIQSDLAKEIGKGLMEPALIRGLIKNGLFEFEAFISASKLTMPVLVVLGRYDGEISIDNAMKFALTVPDGYVTLMEHSGHHPYLEETDMTVERINTFLSSHRALSVPADRE